ERDREPQELRGERFPLERWKRGLMASGDLGVGGGFGHDAVSPGGARAAGSEREQQQERDQQREDAQRLGDGAAEDQVAELAGGGRGLTDRGGEVRAEDGADPDPGAAH